MHFCVPAHTAAARFYRKSPQPCCSTQSICGPHMSPNSGFGSTPLKEKQSRGRKGTKKKINNTTACVIWCDLQSDSVMPTEVKLATDGKVDGHEANICAKLGPQM